MTRTTITTPDEPHGVEPPRRTRGSTRTARGRKRANGEGTIYQRKDGRYEGAAFVPTTAGTVKRVRIYGRTRDDVRRQLTRLLEQADQGIPVAAENWTVARYLAYWLEHVVKPERKPRTYQGYEGVARLYLIPELGNKRVAKLAARDVRLLITRLRAQCLCCKHGIDAARDEPQCCARLGDECCEARLSIRMVQSVHAVLRNALESAVREEVIPRNVAKLVKVSTPKYIVNRGLSVTQARQVLRAARAERLYALYVLALCLGLRRGELLGLRWEDIDLDAGTLEVARALQRVGGALRFVRPKTDDSARTIPLPPLCISALREHRRQQFTERADAWPNWQEHGLVFPTRIGTPMEPDNLRRSWGRIRTAAGLTSTRFHDMRHTCVSLLLHLGVAPDMVRDIVGHSDIEVTMTIYAHTALDEKRQALAKLGDVLT
jgi:integrase